MLRAKGVYPGIAKDARQPACLLLGLLTIVKPGAGCLEVRHNAALLSLCLIAWVAAHTLWLCLQEIGQMVKKALAGAWPDDEVRVTSIYQRKAAIRLNSPSVCKLKDHAQRQMPTTLRVATNQAGKALINGIEVKVKG